MKVEFTKSMALDPRSGSKYARAVTVNQDGERVGFTITDITNGRARTRGVSPTGSAILDSMKRASDLYYRVKPDNEIFCL